MKSEATIRSYTGERPVITRMIRTAPRRVLDVGCSNGTLGAAVKTLFPDAHVVGLEADPDFGAIARTRLDEVFLVDLDTFDPQALPGGFDLVILADVLEHTKRPAAVLENILGKARADAQIIISVPNVQHWTAIANLLAGSWPERDRGLFDRTHLRFFTLRSIVSLAEGCGCTVAEVVRLYRLGDRPGTRLGWLLAVLRRLPVRPFVTYQYVVRLERKA
jgi:SAM-dependent methyltransferase